MKKPYLFLCPLLALIVSCSGVPKNNEQGRREVTALSGVSEICDSAGAQEEAAVNQIMREGFSLSGGRMNSEQEEPVSEMAEIDQPEAIPEEPVLAETEEEKPQAEYVTALSLLDDDIAEETELQPTDQPVIAMETLKPAGAASPAEPVKPAPPTLPERRTAQTVPPDFSPPVRESWKQLPKEEAPAIVQETMPVVEEPPAERILKPDYPITFSRTARVTVGQLVEIPFRGKDWVFLGEVGASRGIVYDSRKTDPEGDSFIFRVDAAGTYALKFYRQDFAHDLILNDHVQIIAGRAPETTGLGWFNPPVDRSKVVAGPRWPNFLEQAPLAAQPLVSQPATPPPAMEQPLMPQPATAPPVTAQPPTASPAPVRPPVAVQSPAEAVKPPPPAAPPAPVQPAARQPARNETPRPQGPSGGAVVAQASPAQPEAQSLPSSPPPPVAEPKSPASFLKEARDEFNAGRIASAITLLDEFRKSYPSGSDEAWWLYGQCFEANSPNRNMLAALEYYRRLVSEYPMSSRLSDARRRIAYLERYYINIQ
jgi:TolA-binding protein